jgi:hypothetical protein
VKRRLRSGCLGVLAKDGAGAQDEGENDRFQSASGAVAATATVSLQLLLGCRHPAFRIL